MEEREDLKYLQKRQKLALQVGLGALGAMAPNLAHAAKEAWGDDISSLAHKGIALGKGYYNKAEDWYDAQKGSGSGEEPLYTKGMANQLDPTHHHTPLEADLAAEAGGPEGKEAAIRAIMAQAEAGGPEGKEAAIRAIMAQAEAGGPEGKEAAIRAIMRGARTTAGPSLAESPENLEHVIIQHTETPLTASAEYLMRQKPGSVDIGKDNIGPGVGGGHGAEEIGKDNIGPGIGGGQGAEIPGRDQIGPGVGSGQSMEDHTASAKTTAGPSSAELAQSKHDQANAMLPEDERYWEMHGQLPNRSDMPSNEILNLATVHKGEGVSHAVMRQLIGGDIKNTGFTPDQEHLAAMGYHGQANDRGAIESWARKMSGKIVTDEKYYDPKTGQQTWVMQKDRSAYVLYGNEKNGFNIGEYQDRNGDGKFEFRELETHPQEIAQGFEKEHAIESGAKTGAAEHLTPEQAREAAEFHKGPSGRPDGEMPGHDYLEGKQTEAIRETIDSINKHMSEADAIIGNDLHAHIDLGRDDGLGLVAVDAGKDGSLDQIGLAYGDKANEGVLTTLTRRPDESVEAFWDRAKSELENRISATEEAASQYGVTPQQANQAGINLFDGISKTDEIKLKFWHDYGIPGEEAGKVHEIFTVADQYHIRPEEYGQIGERLAVIDKMGLAAAQHEALVEMSFGKVTGDDVDKTLSDFFGREKYRDIRGFFKNFRGVEADNRGVFITLDQSKLFGSSDLDVLRLHVDQAGHLNIVGPAKWSEDLGPLTRNSLDHATSKIYSFMGNDVPSASGGNIGHEAVPQGPTRATEMAEEMNMSKNKEPLMETPNESTQKNVLNSQVSARQTAKIIDREENSENIPIINRE